MHLRLLAPLGLAAVVLASVLGPAAPARADEEVETPRFNLIPGYAKGFRYRIVKVFRQTTVTDMAIGRYGGKNLNFSDYDAYSDLQALVRVDEVDTRGEATVWSVLFERFRFDVPNPLESEAYRALQAERRRMGKPRDSHPIEGETVKLERVDGKERIYKVLASGRDYGITNRYPELVGVMEAIVKPDWTPPSPVPIGSTWESDIDSALKVMKVVMRAPLEGKIVSRLASVENGRATVVNTAKLSEEFRRVLMEIGLTGRVEFDTEARTLIRSEFSGTVDISSKGSSLRGTGRISGRTEILPVCSDCDEEQPR